MDENTTIETTKVSENQIEVTKTVTTEPEITKVIFQKQSIQDQKDRDNAQRNIELAEIENLLSECGKLEIGIDK